MHKARKAKGANVFKFNANDDNSFSEILIIGTVVGILNYAICIITGLFIKPGLCYIAKLCSVPEPGYWASIGIVFIFVNLIHPISLVNREK